VRAIGVVEQESDLPRIELSLKPVAGGDVDHTGDGS